LFAGAGEAGTGIADLIAFAVSMESNIPIEEARKKIYLVDSKGLVTDARLDTLQHHKLNYAHSVERECSSLMEAIDLLHPTGLIGVSAIPNMFNKEVCEKMAALNSHPVIFALSNPTSKAECTAQEAYEWTNGTAIFSSGSPFPPVTLADGRTFVPGQGKLSCRGTSSVLEDSFILVFFSIGVILVGNNAYIFPGIGLGVLAAGSTRITNYDMYLAAETLAECVTDEELSKGSLYPPLSKIRSVSAKIGTAIALRAYETEVATNELPEGDMEDYVKSLMYDPFADPYE
jgi:malate dehydrogenase (oxaloacetate-decarboxylating)(NADP+)